MLEADILSSSQYFDRWRGAGYREPERRLMLAVLQEAVDCYQENVFARARKQEKAFEEAERWFFDDNHEWPFSFVNICEFCGFDAAYFRLGLMRRKARALSERSVHGTAAIHGKTRSKLPQTDTISSSQVKAAKRSRSRQAKL
jgi:hypothetical protein